MQGYIKNWVDGKGFGFIAGQDGQDYFVHISAVSGGLKKLEKDTEVSFDPEKTERGWRAINVLTEKR